MVTSDVIKIKNGEDGKEAESCPLNQYKPA